MPGVSDVMCGKVTAIMNFGAFVLLEDGTSGLVHISEISKNFVKDVNDFLWVGRRCASCLWQPIMTERNVCPLRRRRNFDDERRSERQ